MADTVCYIKLNRNVEVTDKEVLFQDLGSVRCADYKVSAKIKNIKVHRFQNHSNTNNNINDNNIIEEKRCVISVLKIIEMIETVCPEITVENLGETEVLIEFIDVNKHKNGVQFFKAALVAVISFFGTAFTIIAYHNDIGINDVFTQIHEIVMGSEPQGVSVLEVAYSIGLSLGIIVFFNHVGGRRLTKDPTPIEVEMRQYESNVNTALVETAEREGNIIDVE